MKNFMLTLLILSSLLVCGCQKFDIEEGTPVCIVDLIVDFDKENSCDKGVTVMRYTFQGKTVFVFDAGTCGADMTSEIINNNCQSIGYLGGIAGNTEINGEDFSLAIFESIVWEK